MGHRRFAVGNNAALVEHANAQARAAEDHRAKAIAARERAADCAQACRWLRGRIEFLEGQLAAIERELAKP